MDVLRYRGANAAAVNTRLAEMAAMPRSTYIAIEARQQTERAGLYSAVQKAAEASRRMNDWRCAADIARAIVDGVEVHEPPALSAHAVGSARLAIASEVLGDLLDPRLCEELAALLSPRTP